MSCFFEPPNKSVTNEATGITTGTATTTQGTIMKTTWSKWRKQ